MDPLFVILIGCVIFLTLCFVIRVKDIDLPGSEPFEKFMVILFAFLACLMWPVLLPIFSIAALGLLITGKHKKQ